MKFHMHGMYKGYDSIMDGTVTVPTADEFLKENNAGVRKAGELTIKINRSGYLRIKINRSGYVDLMLLMSDVKSFNLVKEHQGNLYNAWKALSEKFEPHTEISLIDLLSEFNRNKLRDPKSNVTEWMSMLELQCQ